jgi:hypothetical protein
VEFPLAMGTRKIGPAVAAGCTMIVKPAQETADHAAAGQADGRGGPAKGVLSVLPTKDPGGVTTALIDDGRLRKLTFTGSTGVGKALAKQARRAAAAVDGAGRQRPSWCSTTRTWMPPSKAQCWPRCATAGRPARPPTASTSPTPCVRSYREAGQADE